MTISESLITEARRGHILSEQETLNVAEQVSHEDHHRCVKTHRQGVIQRTYPLGFPSCDITHMSESGEMGRIKAALERAMVRKGIKAKPLSIQAGLGDTAVRDLLARDSGDVRISTLQKLAGVLDCDLEDLLGAAAIPLTGRIGAGGTIVFEDLGAQDSVPRPPSIAGPLEALEVVGDSMLPRYSSGDIVYISRKHEGVLPAYLGEFCAVRLVSGETFVKILARGSKPGFFTLRSLNAADIEDVELQWATPIVFVLSRYARTLIGQ